MKTLFLLAVCLICTVASNAQTTPKTGSAPAMSGTKNVGADRADAPQAPGMSAPATMRAASSTRKSKATGPRGAATPKKQTTATSAQ